MWYGVGCDVFVVILYFYFYVLFIVVAYVNVECVSIFWYGCYGIDGIDY